MRGANARVARVTYLSVKRPQDYDCGGAFSFEAHGTTYRFNEGGGANWLVRDTEWTIDRLFMHGDTLVSMGYDTQPDDPNKSRTKELRRVKTWDTKTWQCTSSATGAFPTDSKGAVLCISVGDHVATVGGLGSRNRNTEVTIWTTPSWRQKGAIKAHGTYIGAIAESCGYLVTAGLDGDDNTIKLWDVDSATCLTAFAVGHRVSSVLASGGKLLICYEPDYPGHNAAAGAGGQETPMEVVDFEVRDLAIGGAFVRAIANPPYNYGRGSSYHGSVGGASSVDRVRPRSVVRAEFTGEGKLVTVDRQGALRLWQ